jgi:hypothetical protein
MLLEKNIVTTSNVHLCWIYDFGYAALIWWVDQELSLDRPHRERKYIFLKTLPMNWKVCRQCAPVHTGSYGACIRERCMFRPCGSTLRSYKEKKEHVPLTTTIFPRLPLLYPLITVQLLHPLSLSLSLILIGRQSITQASLALMTPLIREQN